jgi:photosystem II stability/assembly factor-like uncharacterized protein
MSSRSSFITSLAPLCIIGGLLYAALYIKPAGGGTALEPPVIAPRDHFYAMVQPAGGPLWAVGNDGKVVLGDGQGRWQVQASGTRAHLQSVDAWDARHALAVGNDGTVLSTGDGGQTWLKADAPVSATANKLMRVQVLPDGAAVAVGEFNTVLLGSAYGRQWTRLTPEQDVAWYGLAVRGSRITVAGEFGRLMQSDDLGRSWRPSHSPTEAHLTAVAFADEQRGVAVGLNGTVLLSEDAGRSWQAVGQGGEEHLYDVIWDGRRFVACGDRGVLLESVDGRAWKALDAALGDARNFLWFSRVVPGADGLLLSGATLGAIRGDRFISLAGASGPASAASR